MWWHHYNMSTFSACMHYPTDFGFCQHTCLISVKLYYMKSNFWLEDNEHLVLRCKSVQKDIIDECRTMQWGNHNLHTLYSLSGLLLFSNIQWFVRHWKGREEIKFWISS